MMTKDMGWKHKEEGIRNLLLRQKVGLIHRPVITATQEAEAGPLPIWATE